MKKINLIFCLLFSAYTFSQKVDSHIVNIPSLKLDISLSYRGSPVVKGSVFMMNGKPINDGLFYIFDVEGNIIQVVTYEMGKIVKINSKNDFDKEDKRRL